jgi:hypothetical protein
MISTVTALPRTSMQRYRRSLLDLAIIGGLQLHLHAHCLRCLGCCTTMRWQMFGCHMHSHCCCMVSAGSPQPIEFILSKPPGSVRGEGSYASPCAMQSSALHQHSPSPCQFNTTQMSLPAVPW